MKGRKKKMGGGGEAGGLSLCLCLPASHAKKKSEVHSRGKSLLSAKEFLCLLRGKRKFLTYSLYRIGPINKKRKGPAIYI